MMGIRAFGFRAVFFGLALVLSAGFSFAQNQPPSSGGCPAGHGNMPAGAGEAMNAAYIAQMQAMQEMQAQYMAQVHAQPGGGAGAGPVACPAGHGQPGQMPFDPQEMMNEMLEQMGLPMGDHLPGADSDCGCGGDASEALAHGIPVTTDDQGNTFPGYNGVSIGDIWGGTIGMGYYPEAITATSIAFGGDGSGGVADHAALDLALDWLLDLHSPVHEVVPVFINDVIAGLGGIPLPGTESPEADIPSEGTL